MSDKKVNFVKPTLKFMLKTVWQNKPLLFLLYAAEIILNAVSTFSAIILPKLIIDELIGERNIKILITVTGAFILISTIISILNPLIAYGKSILHEWFNEYFQMMLSKQAMNMDFEHTEDPAVLDQLNKAKEGINWYSGGVEGILSCVVNIIKNIIVISGIVLIIAMGCPWLLVIQLAGLLIISLLNQKIQLIQVKSYKELSKVNRVFGYIFWQLTSFQFGKDIRLYGSKDMMLEKSEKSNLSMTNIWKSMSYKTLKFNEGMVFFNALRDGLSYLYIGYLAINKFITIGDFTMYFNSTGSFYWSMFGVVSNIQEIVKKCNYAHEFLVFLDYPAAMEKGTEKITGEAHTIEFSHVSFKYPRSEKYVLKDISIKITSGEHLAIVGLNGAGKTTFIKLLCRLYDVTEGEILVDGKNIKVYSDEEYRKIFAVVFQDFKLFAFSLKDNIALQKSDISSDDDVYKILTQTALEEDARKLEKGLDTIIYKSFDENGTELSGGQKQKTAISRALFKNAPIVILDEPTAALDPIAEYEIYRQFNTLVGGKTAIYISHRLSSCKFCDKIAVFADDSIRECGTHDELIAYENGIYSNMFKTQAQYYNISK